MVSSYRRPQARLTLTKLIEVVVPSMSSSITLACFMMSATSSLPRFMVEINSKVVFCDGFEVSPMPTDMLVVTAAWRSKLYTNTGRKHICTFIYE